MEWLAKNAELIGILFMPVTYGFIGWLTNVMALKMMFYPLNFVGLKPPYLGWQGIVPRKSTGLALKVVNILSEKLIKIDDFFAKIPTDKLADSYKPLLKENIPNMMHRVLEAVPAELKAKVSANEGKIVAKALAESEQRLDQITGHLKEDVGKVFSFKNMVLRNLTGENTHLLVDLFQEIGKKEFKFIGASGWYFGTLFGLAQMLIWWLYPGAWTLPVQGIIVGYVTNWLALIMIFRPMVETRYLYFFKYQGLFHRRQVEVSDKFSTMFAEHVLNGKNILDEVLYRRISRTVVETMNDDIVQELKADGADAGAIAAFEKASDGSRKEVAAELANRLSEASETMEKLINRSMNVKQTIYNRMKDLPGEDFESLLRSAFQEDEWILIILGAVLGAIVGLGQMFYMLAFAAG
ncbi:DUF445 domain-containing protein [Turneriella parva]|uniref:DUF445 domain-containing protein n=1 Tax=Turneriella parva (strain ATCC BAA-1111 / DSM 21527 / NCTC 11395 / H) TaxID=869212 RepID=I4B5N1_TURPD|nr:DUF445 family protein [Turneriella parva]AFM12588.1 hypothetical protein Turpa_1941 [Turneriella parva DSM 21527]